MWVGLAAFTLLCLLALLYVKISVHRQSDDQTEYVVKKRKVGKCFGCGQCEKGCPLIVEYREKVNKAPLKSNNSAVP